MDSGRKKKKKSLLSFYLTKFTFPKNVPKRNAFIVLTCSFTTRLDVYAAEEIRNDCFLHNMSETG